MQIDHGNYTTTQPWKSLRGTPVITVNLLRHDAVEARLVSIDIADIIDDGLNKFIQKLGQ